MGVPQLLSPNIPADKSVTAKARLALGEAEEAEEKWASALEHYGIGLSLLPKDTITAYFLFNNAARCLNALELYRGGESYCLRAIALDPKRPEAYKNLAICRRGQGDLTGTVSCLLEAIKTNPSDEQTAELFKQLLTDHPTLSLQCPWIGRELVFIERA
jgi:tetratricopeptide (TPR) repeat protein